VFALAGVFDSRRGGDARLALHRPGASRALRQGVECALDGRIANLGELARSAGLDPGSEPACVVATLYHGECDPGEVTDTASKTWTSGGPVAIAGWMAGEGRLRDGTKKMDYAYVLDCDATKAPKFKGLNGQTLVVGDVTSNTCTDDPAKTPAKSDAPFDTMEGSGTGTLGSTAVKVEWKFVDGGVAGSGDSAKIVVKNATTDAVLFSSEAAPIPSYGGGTREGRNTANKP
jgi:hypothetical protein